MNIDAIKKRIRGKGRKIFALLYVNSRPRLATYLPLAQAIAREGHMCVLGHSTDSTPDSEDIAGYEGLDIAFLGPSVIGGLKGIDVFISSEVACNLAPADAVTVGIQHSLPDHGLSFNYVGFLDYNPTLVRSMDYWVVALKQKAEHWKESNFAPAVRGIYPAELLRNRRPTLDIVPGGYPKLDYLRQRMPVRNAGKFIIYCPTGKHLSYSSVTKYGQQIIAALLKEFPDHKIIFRPYPSRDREELRHLEAEFRSNDRFGYDDSVTGISYFGDAAVLVTDRSSVAVTYSLASGKPSVFFEPHRNKGQPYFSDETGYRTFTVQQLLEAVSDALAGKEQWEKKISSTREKCLYHPDDPSLYLARSLPLFAERKGHPEWLSVERSPWLGMFNNEGVKRVKSRNLKLLKRGDTTFVAVYTKEIDSFIEGVPVFEHEGPFVELDGQSSISRSISVVSGAKELIYELALYSDYDRNFFPGAVPTKYSEQFPPMPVLAYPLFIYQCARSRYQFLISSMDSDNNSDKTVRRGVNFDFEPKRWYKLRFAFDLHGHRMLISINDIAYCRLDNVRIDLGKIGNVRIGRGHHDRYWKGRLGYFDVSFNVGNNKKEVVSIKSA